jgi:succinoglycan biosynthesis transport protein ExoP
MSCSTTFHDNCVSATNAERRQPIGPYESLNPVAISGPLEVWNILFHRRGFLVLIGCIGTLLGFAVTLFTLPKFQARASVEVVTLNQDFLNAKSNSPLSDSNVEADVSEVQTQMRLLQGDMLLEHTLSRLDPLILQRLVDVRPPLWKRFFTYRPDPAIAHERMLSRVASNLQIRAVPQTRVIESRYESPDPEAAAIFLNTLMGEVIHETIDARRKTSEQTIAWFDTQLNDVKEKLQRSEHELQRYARSEKLMIMGDKGNVSEERLRQLQQDLEAARSERISKQTRFEIAANSPPDSLPDVLSDERLRDSQSTLTDLQRQSAQLSSALTPEHYKLQRIQAEIAVLETAIRDQRTAVLERIRNDFTEAQRREALLSNAYSIQTKLINSESERAIQYDILKHEVDANRQLYDGTLQRFSEAAMLNGVPTSNIRLVDSARVPRSPSKPNILLSSLTGLFTSLLFGGAYVALCDRADRRLQQWGEASFYLSVPELGVIPSATDGSKRLLHRLLGIHSPRPDGNDVVVLDGKCPRLADSFRSALISVIFALGTPEQSKVIVVTSPGEGEGKSTLASNLAIAGAEVGRRVLLVDADMRRPRMHQVFGLANDLGLSNIVQDMVTGQNGLEHMLHKTHIPRLTVLCSGSMRTIGSSLFSTAEMGDLVRRLRIDFDLVIVDTPPALQIPDARVLGKLADGVILVVRANRTTRDLALATLQRFAGDGTRVLGAVLNDWSRNTASNA